MTDETPYLPDWTAVVPFVGMVVLIGLAALYARFELSRSRRPRVSTFVWLLPFLAALDFLYVWLQEGLYEGDLLTVFAFALAATLGGAVTVMRNMLRLVLDALDGRSRPRGEALRAGIALVALLVCTALSLLALELPWNQQVMAMEPTGALVETLLVLGTLLFLYLLFQRRGAGIALGTGAFALVGVAQYFVACFKDQGITPSDLLSLQTAAAVSDGYVYSLTQYPLAGVALALAGVAVASLVMPSAPARRRWVAANAAANLAAAAAVLAALWAGVTVPSYADDLGFSIFYWDSLGDYRSQGFLPSFVTVYQDMPVEEPEGYSEESAREVEEAYVAAYDATRGASEARQAAEAQFDETTPSIVVVMNETFADLSVMGGLGIGYSGPEGFYAVPDALSRGSLSVSVLGGGTCNSEFEFLTGGSLAYIGNGKYPYVLYGLEDVPSLPRQLSQLGYETTAIHPNLATNWNRSKAYEDLGFDEFIDIESFEGAPVLHSGVTDAATYDKVLEILETSDEPQFVFDVTMQNHSGYDNGDIPAELLTDYEVPGVGDSLNSRLNEYLSCIEASDRDLLQFIVDLSELDRPVVLLFFGDHQPDFSASLNDALFPGENELAHNTRIYQTVHMAWANYDVAGSDQVSEQLSTTVPFLASNLLETIGAPLTDFQKAQLAISESMPSVNLMGFMGADGLWYPFGWDCPWLASYEDLSLVQYLEISSRLR